jgi:hypothetical protein
MQRAPVVAGVEEAVVVAEEQAAVVKAVSEQEVSALVWPELELRELASSELELLASALRVLVQACSMQSASSRQDPSRSSAATPCSIAAAAAR